MGKGIRQINDALEKRQQILSILSDGQWHRHKEILEKTKLSPTTLSKHLKELEKGIVEKRIDIESGEYPYPVYYRLKPELFPKRDLELWNYLISKTVIQSEELWKKYQRPEIFVELLNAMVGTEALHILLRYFTVEKKNEDYLEQTLEHFIISVYRNAIQTLKLQLEDLEKQGYDLEDILLQARGEIGKDFKVMWEQKFKRLRGGYPQILKKLLGKC